MILATETTADGKGKDLTKCEKVGLPEAAQEQMMHVPGAHCEHLPKRETRQRHVKPSRPSILIMCMVAVSVSRRPMLAVTRPQSDIKAFEEKTGRQSGVGFSPNSET